MVIHNSHNMPAVSRHLSGIVDAESIAPAPAQVTQVDCRSAVKVNKEGWLGACMID
jgi:hypothetical protein